MLVFFLLGGTHRCLHGLPHAFPTRLSSALGIRADIDDTLAFGREHGFTRTLFGRKTHFPNIRAANPSFRAGAERAAINAPIQGTSADLIKRDRKTTRLNSSH